MSASILKNLEYGVWDKTNGRYDAVFNDVADAWLWRNSEEPRENFEVRYLSTGMVVPRSVLPQKPSTRLQRGA